MVLESLAASVNEVEALTSEMVQMIIRGDDNSRIPDVLRSDVEKMKSAADDMRGCLTGIEVYVCRKQQTHRL